MTTKTKLAGQVAVITGAGSGIGAATARLVAARGAKVHLADVNGDAAEAVARQIRQAGGTAEAHAVDVAGAGIQVAAGQPPTCSGSLSPARAPRPDSWTSCGRYRRYKGQMERCWPGKGQGSATSTCLVAVRLLRALPR